MSLSEFDSFVEQTLRRGPQAKLTLPADAVSPHARVVWMTALLARWKTPQPASNLADRILEKIKAEETAAPEEKEVIHRHLPWLWRSEWWAAAASIAAFFGILLPLLQHSRSAASRQACQFQFASLAQGINAYRAANSDYLPYVPAPAGATWAWTAKGREPIAPNTRNAFLLVKQGYVAPAGMICPTSPHHQVLVLAEANLSGLDNFQNPEQISYSFHDMAAGQPSISRPQDFALMADRNPDFEERGGNGYFESRIINSLNHGQAGQNVLYHDGHVAWHDTCTVGVHQDNIWTSASKPAGNYEGTEVPVGADDSFLVP